MDYLGLFATAFFLGLSGAMMPGPLTTLSFLESARRSWLASPVIVSGHAIAETGMVVALAAGLSQILTQNWALGLIGIVGGAFLIWMGYGMLREVLDGKARLDLRPVPVERSTTTDDTASPVAARTRPGWLRASLVTAGVLVSISNPYWLVWWATAGTRQLVDALALGLAGPAVFLVGHVSSDFAWNGLLGIAAFSGRRFISDRVYACVIGLCALFLIGIGIIFMYDGSDRWLAVGQRLAGLFA